MCEKLGTFGCLAKSETLRSVIKSSGFAGTVLQIIKTSQQHWRWLDYCISCRFTNYVSYKGLLFMVFVLNKEGKPLMPTNRHGKVRRMLKDGRAKVVNRTPFTIQLLYDSENYVQTVSLGVDAGSKHIGISATTEKNVLFH